MNSNQESKRIVRVWFERSNCRTGYDTFDRFISLWISLNCFYVAELFTKLSTQTPGKKEPGEWQYIAEIARDEGFLGIFNDLQADTAFSNHLDRLGDLVNGSAFITHYPGKIADMRPSRLSEKHAVVFTNPRDFKQFIESSYQVRCNLFHGNKSPSNDADVQLVDEFLELLTMFLQRAYRSKGYL